VNGNEGLIRGEPQPLEMLRGLICGAEQSGRLSREIPLFIGGPDVGDRLSYHHDVAVFIVGHHVNSARAVERMLDVGL